MDPIPAERGETPCDSHRDTQTQTAIHTHPYFIISFANSAIFMHSLYFDYLTNFVVDFSRVDYISHFLIIIKSKKER